MSGAPYMLTKKMGALLSVSALIDEGVPMFMVYTHALIGD